MGGMSAYIPVKSDPGGLRTRKRLRRYAPTRKEKRATGTTARGLRIPGWCRWRWPMFDRLMPQSNQISKQLPDYSPTADDLLQVPEGQITEAGLKQNVAIGLGYVEAWLRGIGCVPLFNLMEDAATAEISRAQLWQWVHHGAKLADGRTVDIDLVEDMIAAELRQQKSVVDEDRYQAYERAAALMRNLIRAPKFMDFLTVPAYEQILKDEGLVVS